MNLSTKQKQTHRHKKTKLWLPKEREGGINQEYGINIYKIFIGNKQGPTIQHRKLYSISCNKLQ